MLRLFLDTNTFVWWGNSHTSDDPRNRSTLNIPE